MGSELPPGLDVGSASDVGRVRESNEDALLTLGADRDGQVLVAVADGMGGHNAGEVASAIAVESLARTFESDEGGLTAGGGNGDGIGDRLGMAVEQANRAIWEAAAADIEKEGMGTTLVCAVVAASGEVTIANVGDSRAYAFAGGQARLVTIDHTWVTDQVRSGNMSEREAQFSPYRHLLTRSLGATPHVQVDLFSGLRLEPGDALVLCSDGVTTYLEPADVSRELRQSATAQQAAERLVKLAVKRGGADNATAVVVRRT
jgi:serine/threonine protein phosphatase PrpC